MVAGDHDLVPVGQHGEELPEAVQLVLHGVLGEVADIFVHAGDFTKFSMEYLVKSPAWTKMSAGGSDAMSILWCRSWVSDIARIVTGLRRACDGRRCCEGLLSMCPYKCISGNTLFNLIFLTYCYYFCCLIGVNAYKYSINIRKNPEKVIIVMINLPKGLPFHLKIIFIQ